MEQVQWGMLIASIVLVLVTIGATGINYFLFRMHVDPEVVVFADGDEARPSLILLRIKNIGGGMAYSIRFSTTEPLPAKAWGLSIEEAEPANAIDYGPLITGIPALGPGSERIITWGQYGGLSKALGTRVIKITAMYESKGRHPFNPTDHVTDSFVDVESFRMTPAVDFDGARQAARHLEKIAQDIGHIASGFRRLRVEIVREEERGGA